MRIRTIKPGYWSDQRIRRLSIPARLMFIACWNLADDLGRLLWDVDYLKSQVFMSDHDLDVTALMAELEAAGRVRPYQHDGFDYAEIPRFEHHQHINRPNTDRVNPPPPWKITDSSVNETGTVTVQSRQDKDKDKDKDKDQIASASVPEPQSYPQGGDRGWIIDQLTQAACAGRNPSKPEAYARRVRAQIEAERGQAIDRLLAEGIPTARILRNLGGPSDPPGGRLEAIPPTPAELLAVPDEPLVPPKSPAAKRAAARARGAK